MPFVESQIVKPMMYIAFIAYFLISLPAGYFFGFIMDWGIIGYGWHFLSD